MIKRFDDEHGDQHLDTYDLSHLFEEDRTLGTTPEFIAQFSQQVDTTLGTLQAVLGIMVPEWANLDLDSFDDAFHPYVETLDFVMDSLSEWKSTLTGMGDDLYFDAITSLSNLTSNQVQSLANHPHFKPVYASRLVELLCRYENIPFSISNERVLTKFIRALKEGTFDAEASFVTYIEQFAGLVEAEPVIIDDSFELTDENLPTYPPRRRHSRYEEQLQLCLEWSDRKIMGGRLKTYRTYDLLQVIGNEAVPYMKIFTKLFEQIGRNGDSQSWSRDDVRIITILLYYSRQPAGMKPQHSKMLASDLRARI